MTTFWTIHLHSAFLVRKMYRHGQVSFSLRSNPFMKNVRSKTLLFGSAIFATCYAGSLDNSLGAASFGPAVNLKATRQSHTATLLQNGKILLAGGGIGVPLSSAELYDPDVSDPFLTTLLKASMKTNRVYHTATLLPNGKVLVAGGSGSSGNLSSAELYDPLTGTWAFTGSMKTNHAKHTATLLANGKVLVTGGQQQKTSELYDPTTETWAFTGSMTALRQNHTATLLADGRVLVTGGEGMFVNVGLSSAEIYNPTNGTWSTITSLNIGRRSHTATLLPNG